MGDCTVVFAYLDLTQSENQTGSKCEMKDNDCVEESIECKCLIVLIVIRVMIIVFIIIRTWHGCGCLGYELKYIYFIYFTIFNEFAHDVS